ncbi:MAG: FAD-dependent thymidylate synthase [Acidobacteria bacterium]|nr:FAD-dependent thymidylate synthase [Acidobacteriota bacterium]
MQVKLAGFNIDSEIMQQLDPHGRRHLTPETLSAAYARISRSPLSIDQLRKKACLDMEKARKSNQKIIFEMGHHSVAEHAVFNFDIMGVSRLALEEIEKFRLVSYTEKSQRYVTLDGDFITPAELKSPALKKVFQGTIKKQNRFYFKAFAILNKRLQDQHRELTRSVSGRNLVEGWAKEDARYILSLATSGQVGMTINARNLEHLFRRFRLNPRDEVRKLAEKLYALVLPIAPSIILFPEPSAFERETFSTLDKCFRPVAQKAETPFSREPKIVSFSENGDNLILASHLSVSQNLEFARAMNTVKKVSAAQKKLMFMDFFRKIQFFDAPPREFEMADITFQAIVSAANFAQLKRHRMATLLSGPYIPELGTIVPASVTAAGLEKEFRQIIDTTNSAYCQIKEKSGAAADYILTNSHCRRVLMKMNLREMYHFVRLRDDAHAQWDIRNLAHRLSEKIKTLMPLTAMMLCGKSGFTEEYKKIFKTPPPD